VAPQRPWQCPECRPQLIFSLASLLGNTVDLPVSGTLTLFRHPKDEAHVMSGAIIGECYTHGRSVGGAGCVAPSRVQLVTPRLTSLGFSTSIL